MSSCPSKLSEGRRHKHSQSTSSYLDDPSRIGTSTSSTTTSPSHNFIKNQSSSATANTHGTTSATPKMEFPPIPPSRIRQVVDPSAISIQHVVADCHDDEHSSSEQPEEDCVININLSQLNDPAGMCLPDSIKLHSDEGTIATSSCSCLFSIIMYIITIGKPISRGGRSPSYSLVLHSKATNSSSNSPPKPLWRKREVVRQERTVHYTTIDEHGDQQVIDTCLLH